MIEEQIDERGGKLSASGLERATLCNGSPAAEKGKPENLMAETTAGTRIHDAVEVDDPTKLEDEDEQKMAVRLMELRDLEIAAWSKGEEVHDEREIRLLGFDGEFSGKPDGVVTVNGNETRALIYDHKTGYHEAIEATRNHQLRALAVLAWENVPSLVEITVAIFQPRVFPEITKTVYELEDLKRAQNEIRATLEKIADPMARRTPGPVQCRYCRAKADCPEAASLAAELTKVNVAEISADRVVQMLDVCETAKGIIKAVEARAKELLEEDPNSLDGWTLRPGAKKSKIVDPVLLFGRLNKYHGIESPEFVKVVDINKTALKKLLKETTDLKGKGLEAELANMMDGLTNETQNAPSLKREK